ncbi:MAG: S24 family peptidase [Gemmatimonadaceae bacterium]
MSDHDESLKRWLRGDAGESASGREPLRHLEPLAAIPPGAELSPELREQIEFEADLLVQLVGDYFASQPDASIWSDPRFLDWQMEQIRAENERLLTDEELLAEGRRFRARVEARRLRVGCDEGRPPERRASTRGIASRVIEVAEKENAMPLVDLAVAAGVGRELWDEPVESWIERPKGTPPGRYLALRIAGESMSPLMHSGDTVVVRIGSAVAPETVIVARTPDGGYVCKCVGRLRSESIELLSLDHSHPPVSLPRDARLILGTVCHLWCHHRGKEKRRED